MTMKKKFKIRHRGTGLYSTGGIAPKWDKKGSHWPKKSLALKDIKWYRMNQNPLLSISEDSIDFYAEAEIVEFRLSWKERNTEDVN
jgi:hypothetical protein